MKNKQFSELKGLAVGSFFVMFISLLIVGAIYIYKSSRESSPPNDLISETSQTQEPENITIPTEPIANQISVTFKAGTSDEAKKEYIASIGGTIVSEIQNLDTYVVNVNEEVANKPLPENETVAASEPDFQMSALADISNDAKVKDQWALETMNVKKGWDDLKDINQSFTVAVIDSGICTQHEDLKDKFVGGKNFIDNSTNVEDDFGHGCSVSGIIASTANNSLGIAGVAPNVKILPLKVLDNQGLGSYSNVAAAIVYAADNGAKIINLSLGGPNASSLLESAVNYAKSKNVIVVAASGNTGREGVLYPAAYEYVIAVGSVDKDLKQSSFTTFGPQLDIYAPGRDILTTKKDGSYGLVSGTSFAAPQVVGIEAIALATGKNIKLDGKVLAFDANKDVVISSEPPINPPGEQPIGSDVQGLSFPQCSGAPFITPSYGKRGDYIWRSTTKQDNPTAGEDYKHDGLDIIQVNQQEKVEPVYAVADGYLTSDPNKRWALRIEIDVPSSYDVPNHHVYAYYTHMGNNSGSNSYVLEKFQGATTPIFVRKGELLGYQGRKGVPDELVHLHISVSTTNSEVNNIDPTKYFGDINLDAMNGGVTDRATPAIRCKTTSSTYQTGDIGGTLRDASNNPLNILSQINIITSTQIFSKWSDANGVFSFTAIPVGSVTFKATSQAGNSIVINNLNIVENFTKIINPKLNNSCVDGSAMSVMSDGSVALDCTPLGFSAPSNGCGSRPNGFYCGQTLGLNTDNLYKCANGISSIAQTCNNGCSVQAQGTADFCLSAPSAKTCPNNKNGTYCGDSLALNTNKLYDCQYGVSTEITSCQFGCAIKPAGTADVCKGAASTGTGVCPSGGDGDYCGSTLGLDENKLYTCNAGKIQEKATCGNGCKPNPPLTPDVCYAAGEGGSVNNSGTVKFFGDSNMTGNVRLSLPAQNSDEPSRNTIYKSIEIPSGWSIVLHDKPLNEVGNTQCFNQSIPLLESQGGWSTSIESVEVHNTNVCPSPNTDSWVKICKNTGISDCTVVTTDIPDLSGSGFGDNVLKSIDFAGNWEAVLYEHGGYGGRNVTLSDDNNDLGGLQFGYGASSISVRRKDPAIFTLYVLGNLNGTPFQSDRSIENLGNWQNRDNTGQSWDNLARSIRVTSGYEVILCSDASSRGTCARFNSNQNDLGSVQGEVSSAFICQGSCPPGATNPTLVSPLNEETFLPNSPLLFNWVGDGEQYDIEIWGGDLTNPIKDFNRNGVNILSKAGLAGSANPYSWHVKAYKPYGPSNWSPTFTFKVQDIAPSYTYISGPSTASISGDNVFTAFVSPSNSDNLTYNWIPEPVSGQGTKTATYSWSMPTTQNITVNIANTGGSLSTSMNISVSCEDGKYLAEYYNNQNLTGTPSYSCEDAINNDWQDGGPTQVPSNSFNVGNGSDGALTVAPGETIYTDNIRSKINSATASGQKVVCTSSILGYFTGSSVLIIQSKGVGVGNYEFNTVTSVAGGCITMQNNLTNSYDSTGAQVIRIPQYTTVDVYGTLTVHPWDGQTGGVMAFKASNYVKIRGGGIDVSAKGYRAGGRAFGRASTGVQGEGISNYVPQSSREPNSGGGGGGPGSNDGGSAAGGGSYSTGGAAGYDPTYGDFGYGAVPYYTDGLLPQIFFGGAGGAGGTDDSGWDNATFGGRGGNGGGVILIETNVLDGNGQIKASGEKGEDHNGQSTSSEHGGGGGGAGGSIKILADKMNIDSLTVNYSGAGGGMAKQGSGGAGGTGLGYFSYCTKTGTASSGWVVASDCNKDHFSVRWTGNINFANSNTYSFATQADDGIRLFLDGSATPLINRWADGFGNDQANQALTSGNHVVKVEYYDSTNTAIAKLNITQQAGVAPILDQIPGQAINNGQTFQTIDLNSYVTNFAEQTSLTWSATGNTNISVAIANNVATLTYTGSWVGTENITFKATNQSGQEATSTAAFVVNTAIGTFTGNFYNNMTLSGTPVLTNTTTAIDYDWQGSPGAGVNADIFSTSWVGDFDFPTAGDYTFIGFGDDGIRTYVDDVLIMDGWVNQGTREYRGKANLTAGVHNVRFDFYEYGGGAIAKLNWVAGDQMPTYTACTNAVNNYCATYYNTTDLTGPAIVTRNETAAINYDWGSGAAAMNVLGDNSTARWQGDFTFAAGTYRFTSFADDGIRAWIDGVSFIDRWSGAYWDEDVDKVMTAGNHTIKVEFLEYGGGAATKFIWAQISGNQAPTISTSPGLTGSENVAYTYDVNATDPENNTLTYSLAQKPTGMTINSSNGIISWTPSYSQSGTIHIKVGVSDGTNTVYQEYDLVISNVNRAPTFTQVPGQTITSGQAFTTINLPTYGTDPDSDAIAWSYSGNTNITVAIASGVATLTYPGTWTGTNNITFKATDPSNAFATSTAAFVVNPVSTCPYTAQYYNNKTLSGSPVLTRCENEISYNWYDGNPGPGVNADNFSVRWTGSFNFAAGTYNFVTETDDGVRLWIDNVQKINDWTAHNPKFNQVSQTLTAGSHTIKIEYYAATGGAKAVFNWLAPQTQTSNCVVQNKFCAKYFNNTNLSGTPVLSVLEGDIDHDWGSTAPGGGVNADNYSVRWEGSFEFATATYDFGTASDDGVRLWVDGVLVIDNWVAHGYEEDYASVNMTEGFHTIKMEYYEQGGGAIAAIWW